MFDFLMLNTKCNVDIEGYAVVFWLFKVINILLDVNYHITILHLRI